MNYIIDGFMDAADLIFMLMFAGGAFHLITESGALQASIAKVARKFSNRFYIFIPMLTLIFTLIATNQGVKPVHSIRSHHGDAVFCAGS